LTILLFVNIILLKCWSSQRALDDVLVRLYNNFTFITSEIPNKYVFLYDGYNCIYDGGNDMYDSGNFLKTNLGSPIQYTSGIVGSSLYLGSNSYFTAQLPGLFVFVSDLSTNSKVQYFSTYGDTGANGAGYYSVYNITVNYSSAIYTGYIKLIYGTVDPSIGHIMFVKSYNNHNPTLNTYSKNTNNDTQMISPLANYNRLYYILISSLSPYVTSFTDFSNVMNAFLAVIDDEITPNVEDSVISQKAIISIVIVLGVFVFLFLMAAIIKESKK